MELIKYVPRKRVPRSIFTLIGTLVKENENSILIKRVNSKTQIWIDKDEGEVNVAEGEMGTFQITISTYVGRDGNIIWTKPRLVHSTKLEGEVQSDHSGFMGVRTGVIEDFFETDVEMLKIIKFKASTEEIFYLRYYSEKNPMKKNCTIDFDLRSTSILVDSYGNAFTSPRDAEYTDESGKQISKKVNRWFPSIEVKDIKYTA